MLVKICGIKTLEAATAATESGADFLGLNFVPSSKRCISVETAREIITGLRFEPRKAEDGHGARLVGVFQDQPLEFVNKTADELGLDFVQLHGSESPEYCAQIKMPIIKAYGLDSDFDIAKVTEEMSKYRVTYYLLDRNGREGESLNAKKVAELAKKFPIILAGGLTPENVSTAIAVSGRIRVVDVAGGVETNGEKDPQKIRRFISSAK